MDPNHFNHHQQQQYYDDDTASSGGGGGRHVHGVITNRKETVRIRLQASNLPRYKIGPIRSTIPDTFAVVTSISSSSTTQQSSSSSSSSSPSQQYYQQGGQGQEEVRVGSSTNHPAHRRGAAVSSVGYVWGRTEIIQKSFHPQWTKVIYVEYEPLKPFLFYVHIFAHRPITERRGQPEQQQQHTKQQSHRKVVSRLFQRTPKRANNTTEQQKQQQEEGDEGSSGEDENDNVPEEETDADADNNEVDDIMMMDPSSLDYSSSIGVALFDIHDVLRTKHCTRVKRLRKGGVVFCRIERVVIGDSNEQHNIQHNPNDPAAAPYLSHQFRFRFGAIDLVLPNKQRKNKKKGTSYILELSKYSTSTPTPTSHTKLLSDSGSVNQHSSYDNHAPPHSSTSNNSSTGGSSSGNSTHHAAGTWITVYRSNVAQEEDDAIVVVNTTTTTNDTNNNQNTRAQEEVDPSYASASAQTIITTTRRKSATCWDESTIDLGTLCNADLEKPIRITVLQIKSGRGGVSIMHGSSGRGDETKVVGMAETNLRYLLRMGLASRQQNRRIELEEKTRHPNCGKDDESSGGGDDADTADGNHCHDEDHDDDNNYELMILRPNELYLQRSVHKLKKVGKICVLDTEVVKTESCQDHVSGIDDGGGKTIGSDRNQQNALLPTAVAAQPTHLTPSVSIGEEMIARHDDMMQSWSTNGGMDVQEVVDIANLQPMAPPSSPVQSSSIMSPTTPIAVAVSVPFTPNNNSSSSSSSFRHYIDRGCELDFCVALDFTSSNGDPRHESSLHYQNDQTYNDYEETILAIGRAIDAYSKSQEYCVWGFGAKFHGTVRHLFQCGSDVKVRGVDGILAAYKSVFQSDLIMSGPTILMQVIQAAAINSRKLHQEMTPKSLRYNVLLIVTDGLADEFEETRRKLAVYSGLPLSVVIVGVGNHSDFSMMYQLSYPSQSWTSNTQPQCRVNTSFVEFRKHQHNPIALGEAALQQIPTQLCEYMQMRGF